MCIRDRSRMFQLPNTRSGEDNIETTTVNTLITNFPLAFKDIAYHQQQDPKLCKIIEQTEKGNNSDKYTLSKRVLCFKKANGKLLRIIAPEIIKPMLMDYYHSSTIGAHMELVLSLIHI